jgi:16S rRNA (cytidine1402-2'-O)-methyltransferase
VVPPDSGDAARRDFAPGLYLVATPIGNAEDVTLRALRLLRAADVIACEDTRVSAKLLARHAISRPLRPYHEHNAARAGPALIERLKGGEIVALVSDAGTPLISDPGFRLVQAAIAAGVAVTALPGASSVPVALSLSGLPSDRFLFAGFLPSKPAARRRAIAELAAIPATLLLLEAANRLPAALADLAELLGPRPAAVARELTKRFEEVRRGDLAALARHYAAAGPPKGELVLVIGPPEAAETAPAPELDRALRLALAHMGTRDAAELVAAASGRSRRELYERALALGRSR